MSSAKLHERWRRRLLALERRVHDLFEECRGTGSATTVHDLRVAIRRARLYAQVGRPLLSKASLKQFHAWGRMVNRLLGPVRDCDVCMKWLAAGPGSVESVGWVNDQRTRLWRLALDLLKRRSADPPRGFVFRKTGKNAPGTLTVRYDRELRKLVRGVRRSVPNAAQMTPPELHDLRRRLRRWRYLRELGLAAKAQGRDPALEWLILTQGFLGESQNLEMAVALLEAYPALLERERLVRRASGEQARWIQRARRQLARLPDTAL